jgi:glycosyltransferase involved in cell wall biosynthesis
LSSSVISHQPSVIAGEACSVHLVFWQPIPSFHQEGFFCALAQADWVHSVTLKYESELSEDRRQSGWREGVFQGVKLEQIQASEVPVDTAEHIHIFTGFDTHPMIWAAFHRLPTVAQCCRFAFVEAPECIGWKGVLRRLKYKVASWKIAPRLDGILALGQLGVDFYCSVLPQSVPVHQLAYYDVSLSALSQFERPKATVDQRLAINDQQSTSLHSTSDQPTTNNQQPTTLYHFLYVGQLIHRKGVDRLMRSLAELSGDAWTLDLVGEGSEKASLEQLGSTLGISEKLKWHGSVPSSELHVFYQQADCLVLPSRWDGWGMTVNEALRNGCDVLASETCGAASAVSQSARLPKDAVFWTQSLETKMRGGSIAPDARVANQQIAQSLSGEAGAERLKSILTGSMSDD